MAPNPKVLEIVQGISNLNLFELAELVGVLEIDGEVSKLAHVIQEYMTPTPIVPAQIPVYAVKMCSNEKKIQSIKVVRHLTGWGLKEAKDFVDMIPLGDWETVTTFPSYTEAHDKLSGAIGDDDTPFPMTYMWKFFKVHEVTPEN